MGSRTIKVTIPPEHLDILDDRARVAASGGVGVTLSPPEVAVLVGAYRDRDRERQAHTAQVDQLRRDAGAMTLWGVGVGLLLGRWL